MNEFWAQLLVLSKRFYYLLGTTKVGTATIQTLGDDSTAANRDGSVAVTTFRPFPILFSLLFFLDISFLLLSAVCLPLCLSF